MRAILLIGLLLISSMSLAQSIGLKPTFFSLGRAEAITSTAMGTEALFYNPAGLSWMDVEIRLIGIEQSGDSATLKRINEIVESDSPEESLTLAELYRRLNSEEQIYARTTIRAVDVILPFIGVSSFVDAQLQNINKEENGVTTHEMTAQADVGGIAGLGFRIGMLGFGVSYYRMGRTALISSPTTAQRNEAIQATANNTISTETVPFREFSRFQYGGAEGYNVGFQFRPNPKKVNGIGVAVLNAGGTKFTPDIKFDDPKIDQLETQMLEETANYGIELETPDPIPEVVNVGLSYGLTEIDSPLELSFNIDGNDLAGDSVKNKVAISAKIGLTLPDAIAMATSIPIAPLDKENKHFAHIGLLGLYAFGGYRPGEYSSAGATLALHLGADRRASIFKFELTAMALTPDEGNEEFVERAGTLLTAGLTLVVGK